MARRIYTEEKTMKRIAILDKDEEVVVRGNNVFVRKKFDAYGWARNFICRHDLVSVSYRHIENRITVAIFPSNPDVKPGIAICDATDNFMPLVGKAIALARLLNKPLPKELFE